MKDKLWAWSEICQHRWMEMGLIIRCSLFFTDKYNLMYTSRQKRRYKPRRQSKPNEQKLNTVPAAISKMKEILMHSFLSSSFTLPVQWQLIKSFCTCICFVHDTCTWTCTLWLVSSRYSTVVTVHSNNFLWEHWFCFLSCFYAVTFVILTLHSWKIVRIKVMSIIYTRK